MVVASMANGFSMPKYGLIPVWYMVGSTLTLPGAALMCKFLLSMSCKCSNLHTLANVLYRHHQRHNVQHQHLRLQYPCRKWYMMLRLLQILPLYNLYSLYTP